MGRSPCCEKAHTNKGAWTKEEDDRLVAYIKAHGEGCWRSLPKAAGLLRCGKSCRLRWTNYLRPDLKRGLLTDAEEQVVIDLHAKLGNRYVVIISMHAHPSILHSVHAMHMRRSAYGSIATENSSHTELFSRAPYYILLCTTYMTINQARASFIC